MKDYIATIVKNEKIADNIHAVNFLLDEDVRVRCGQFGNISVGETHLLRRPIAICKAEGNEVTFCYQIKGEGTQKLKTMVHLMQSATNTLVTELQKQFLLLNLTNPKIS